MHKIQFKFQKSFRSSASGPSWSTSFLIPLLYVHPLVEFLNTPLDRRVRYVPKEVRWGR